MTANDEVANLPKPQFAVTALDHFITRYMHANVFSQAGKKVDVIMQCISCCKSERNFQ